MEPDWTKSIPDWVICDWFYIIFIVDVILFSILIFIALWLLFTIKGSKVLLGGRLFMYLITLLLLPLIMRFGRIRRR